MDSETRKELNRAQIAKDLAAQNAAAAAAKANTRESRVSIPDPKPVIKKQTSVPTPKTNAQISSTAQKILDDLNAMKTRVDAIKIPEFAPSQDQNNKNYNDLNVSTMPITPTAAVPATTPTVAVVATPPVKTASIDTVLFDDETVPIEVMTDLIFENIGGHELINIARNDIVNGQQVSYQPIKNLSSIQQQFNPNNILSLQSTSDKYFANFSIKLENKIPQPGTGPNGAHVYLDNNTGSMIIEAINLEVDEQIEVEITTSGTIYEAEFGESNS